MLPLLPFLISASLLMVAKSPCSCLELGQLAGFRVKAWSNLNVLNDVPIGICQHCLSRLVFESAQCDAKEKILLRRFAL